MSLQGGGRGNEVGDTSSCQRKGWGIKLDLETKSYNAYPPPVVLCFLLSWSTADSVRAMKVRMREVASGDLRGQV